MQARIITAPLTDDERPVLSHGPNWIAFYEYGAPGVVACGAGVTEAQAVADHARALPDGARRMSDLLTHYAQSTGALSANLIYAETSLRVALQCNRTEAGLRRSMVELLGSVERAVAEHKAREAVAMAPFQQAAE